MSRVAKSPVSIPNNITVKLSMSSIFISGPLGSLKYNIHKFIKIDYKKNFLFISHNHASTSYGWMQAGTCRSILQNMVFGVIHGFTKKLQLFGVGYRAIVEKINILKLFLGFSHPVVYHLPTTIKVKILSNNEIVLTGIDKQLVGQVAANIRAYRIPEPYKGKGIRYINEKIRIKEAKKK